MSEGINSFDDFKKKSKQIANGNRFYCDYQEWGNTDEGHSASELGKFSLCVYVGSKHFSATGFSYKGVIEEVDFLMNKN